MSKQGLEQSQYYQEDFLASHSVLPGSEEARRMTVTSGRKCCELYRKSGPLGLLVRMLLESSQWRSTRCYLTWKASATPARRLLFRLVPSMPRTEGTGPLLWPTAVASDYKRRGPNSKQIGLPEAVRMWPTPSATDCGRTAINPVLTPNGTIRHMNKSGGQSYARLDAVAAMFPTPIASDWKNRGCKDYRKNRECQLQTTVGGQLNPTWVEWLMGFPIGWTDLSASETPSCHSSSTQSSGQ